MSKALLPNGSEVETDENHFIKVKVNISLSQIVSNDLEGFLDLLSKTATGSSLLTQVNYKPVAIAEDGSITMEVSGDITCVCYDKIDEKEKI